jgi:Regulator of Ty1 transposition protein 107 BRCT domain
MCNARSCFLNPLSTDRNLLSRALPALTRSKTKNASRPSGTAPVLTSRFLSPHGPGNSFQGTAASSKSGGVDSFHSFSPHWWGADGMMLEHQLPPHPPPQFFINRLCRQELVKLGSRVGVRPDECTHLVVKTLVQTEKLLCAMAVASTVKTERWVRNFIAAKKLLCTWLFHFVSTPP